MIQVMEDSAPLAMINIYVNLPLFTNVLYIPGGFFSPDFSHQPDMNDRYLYGIYG